MMQFRLGAVAAVIVGGLWGAGASAQVVAPQVIASGFRPGMCMDIREGGNDAILWACHGQRNQQFSFLFGTSGQLQVMCRCLGAAGGEGTALAATPCRSAPAQRWTLRSDGRLQNDQGFCADVKANGGQGAQVIAWRCHNGANQRWRW